ncbi:MAG: 3-hydroxyacyl-ACP dehydratase FabZ [Candidatus Tectomicrobia bacterium]|uniref:3-hydroxyacyl-[acyl-carrier-protein] dehydratase FabZ n=1 Tax=Tectimicrobiota bacterium TaxID=2528274 RepID=A0A932GR72_UNCTE|nr:3-hydroxyacyl-ACP dehydratase FabZ [Candidatus Tectomicrobia bacterium]
MTDFREAIRALPHRYPFLLVDRILEIEGDKRIVGLKNVTINEPFFQGHFPGHPIMPGVLILEAMAQVAGVLALQVMDQKGSLAYFVGIDKARFRKPVLPGDQLRLELEVLKRRGPFWRFQGRALVEDRLVCEAELEAMVVQEGENIGSGEDSSSRS